MQNIAVLASLLSNFALLSLSCTFEICCSAVLFVQLRFCGCSLQNKQLYLEFLSQMSVDSVQCHDFCSAHDDCVVLR